MTSPSKPLLPEKSLAFEPEAAVAWAQRRHAMLDRLAALGMRLAEEVVERAVDTPYHPEPKHEPVRAYDKVARAVRLTLVLQARVEAEIIALRNEQPVPSAVAPELSSAPPRPMRERARDAVADAIDLEMPEGEAAERALGHLRENLIEGETYDDLLALPFRDCVAAICADLGLDPDWSRWADETGFAEHAELLRHERRRDRAEGREMPETVRQYVAARCEGHDRAVELEPG